MLKYFRGYHRLTKINQHEYLTHEQFPHENFPICGSSCTLFVPFSSHDLGWSVKCLARKQTSKHLTLDTLEIDRY